MTERSRLPVLHWSTLFTLIIFIRLDRGTTLDGYSIPQEKDKWKDLVTCTEPFENPGGYQNLSSQSHSDEELGRICHRLNERVGNRLPVCCTADLQHDMIVESRHRLSNTLTDLLINVRHALVTSAAKLDDYFTQLLEGTKRGLHETFSRTHPQLLQHNGELFVNLISDLNAHHHNIFMDFSKTVDNFFLQLLTAIIGGQVPLMDPSTGSSGCVGIFLDEKQPFGSVPQKMLLQIRRSFLAFSAFTEGLDVGRDVIAVVVARNISRHCNDEVANLLYCPYCIGLAGIRPCIGYCLRAVDSCLADRSKLNKLWNNYIEEMLQIMNRLTDSHSTEFVLTGLDSLIAEALENYLSNSDSIKQQLESGCGSPVTDDIEEGSPSMIALDPSSAPPHTDVAGSRDSESHPSKRTSKSPYENLLKEATRHLEALRDLWRNLPENLCQTFSAIPFIESECWNGIDKQSSHQVEDGKFYETLATDSIGGRGRHIISDIDKSRLRNVISRLVLARVGLSSDWWSDSDDEDGDGSSGDEGSSGFDEDLTFLSNNDSSTLQHSIDAINGAPTFLSVSVSLNCLDYILFVTFNCLVGLNFSLRQALSC